MIEFVRSQISFCVDKIKVFYPATNRVFLRLCRIFWMVNEFGATVISQQDFR